MYIVYPICLHSNRNWYFFLLDVLLLQVLVDDSARLQAAYPGSNAEHIAEQQALVVENWNTLQERASRRKEELHAAADLHRFLADVRDNTFVKIIKHLFIDTRTNLFH